MLNLIKEWDEDVCGSLIVLVVLVVTKNLWLSLALGAITYIALFVLTKPVEEVEEPIVQQVEVKPAVRVKKKEPVKKFGDVYLNDTFKINLIGQNIFLAAITRFGKTSLLNLLIVAIHNQYTSKQMVLFVIDLKKVSFGVLNDSPLISDKVYTSDKGVVALHKELERRTNLFVELSKESKKVVADISKYNNVVGKGKKLPPMIVIVDEIQKLDKTHGEMMANIVRTGLAMGINVIATSQRTTSDSVSTAALQQYDIRLIGKMKNSKEYGYANVDSEIAQLMLADQSPGRFACEVDGEWSIQQTIFVSDEKIEELVSTFSKTKTHQLTGNVMQRNTQVMQVFPTKPTIKELMDTFNCTRDEARTFREVYA